MAAIPSSFCPLPARHLEGSWASFRPWNSMSSAQPSNGPNSRRSGSMKGSWAMCCRRDGPKRRPAKPLARQTDAIGATTINKVCGSGVKATMLAHDIINAGSASVVRRHGKRG